MDKPKPNCGNCAYFEAHKTGGGLCCRNAPDASTSGAKPGTARWPHVLASQWCGQHDWYPDYLKTLPNPYR